MDLKRFFDCCMSVAALTVLFPFFLVLAILIKIDTSGPVFYRAKRVGRDGEIFFMYKFRTMRRDADKMGPAVTFNNDPRITRVGNWLRRFRVDELPQFINVLIGDMSIVGPRPEAPEFVQLDLPIWEQVLSVRPGICGLTQLACAIDEAALLTEQDSVNADYLTKILPVKLKMDLAYIRKQSFFYDIYLLVQTALLLLRQKQMVSLGV